MNARLSSLPTRCLLEHTIPISARHAHSASSSRWLARQKSDPFVRQRAQGGTETGAYRSRAAFKLLEIQEKFKIIRPGATVVDLGCAPGAWSQVAADLALKNGAGRVIGIDLLRTEPLENVTLIQGDILDQSTYLQLLRLLPTGLNEDGSDPSPPSAQRCVDVVLSDMAPSITGNRTADIQNTVHLAEMTGFLALSCLSTAAGDGEHGRAGGSLVMKFFEHPQMIEFRKKCLERAFRKVFTFKPKASRSESSETYWVALDLQPQPPT